MSAPFQFIENPDDVPLTKEALIFQALGAASACWEKLEDAGVFDSTRAKQIGEELIARLFPTPSRELLQHPLVCTSVQAVARDLGVVEADMDVQVTTNWMGTLVSIGHVPTKTKVSIQYEGTVL